MNSKTKCLTLLVSLACAQPALAQDGDDMFKFSGFGTVGVAHSSETNADVTSDTQTDEGVGASDEISALLDSRLGVQVNANFTDNLSGVVQLVSEYAVEKSYTPQLTMAHLKYQFSPAFTARLGRLNMPFYMLSEYQRVGYAMPWVRPPQEVYNYLMPLDGIEGNYTINAGDTVIGLQGFFGRIKTDTVDVKRLRGLAVQVDHGSSSFRVSHIRGHITLTSDSIALLFDTYENLPIPDLAAMATDLDPRGVDGNFTGAGYSYDPGEWFMRAEVVRGDYSPSIAATTTSGYLSAGFRRGAWTPSLTVAHVDTSNLEMPGALDPIGILNQAVAGNFSGRHSYTAALRWDFYSNFAMKLQASHVQNHAGSFGALDNIQPGFQPGRSYNLVSASIDFVF